MDMLTEDQAKTKWCPLANTPRFSHQTEDCIGSACMAWRRELVSTFSTDSNGDHIETVVGFCGAFGRPGQ